LIGIFFRFIFFFILPASGLYWAWNAYYLPSRKEPVQKEVPAESQATPSATKIEVTTNPSGAALTLDGELKGQTPLFLELTPKKMYEVRIEKRGYKTLNDQLFVTGDQNSYPFKLEKDLPDTGSLYVDSNPPGAKISFDQTNTDQVTPATVEGLSLNVEHQISVTKDGYHPSRKTIVLKVPQEKIIFDLEKSTTTLKINVVPSDARVLLDGQERGQVIEDLVGGRNYTLTVEAPGFVAQTRKIRPSGPRVEVDIELKKVVIGTGTISLNAIPWAKVLIDGKEVGDTPQTDYKLSTGPHEITFRHPDYPDVKKKISISRGDNPPIIVNMKSPGE
jgi:hypothetical protein